MDRIVEGNKIKFKDNFRRPLIEASVTKVALDSLVVKEEGYGTSKPVCIDYTQVKFILDDSNKWVSFNTTIYDSCKAIGKRPEYEEGEDLEPEEIRWVIGIIALFLSTIFIGALLWK